MMTKEQFHSLYTDYAEGRTSAENLNHFLELLEQEPYTTWLEELVAARIHETKGLPQPEREARVWSQLEETRRGRVVKMPTSRKWGVWAAAIMLCIALGSYWLLFRQKTGMKAPEPVAQKANDIPAPAGSRAMITLADGRTVTLENVNAGMIAQEAGVKVIRNKNGEIIYEGLAANKGPQAVYNTLTNPRGSNIVHLTLADGTNVWLNSESSIKYPVTFNNQARKVEVTGEAYFEVAKQKVPFIVSSNNMVTEVLGTHFNVNAYENEGAVKVTLLEGRVRLSTLKNNLTLSPGQQGEGTITEIKLNKAPDLAEVMAWKQGRFQFNGTSIQQVMRQVERWYDVKVTYPNGMLNETFGGTLSRDVNLSELVRILEYSDIKAEIRGRELRIYK